MKKIFALLLAVAMMATLLAGCGNDTKSTAATEAPTEAPNQELSADWYLQRGRRVCLHAGFRISAEPE